MGTGQKRPAGQIKGAVQELAQDVATLCIHPVYISTIAGQTLYTGELLPSIEKLSPLLPVWESSPCEGDTSLMMKYKYLQVDWASGVSKHPASTQLPPLCSLHWGSSLPWPQGGAGCVFDQRRDSRSHLWRGHSPDGSVWNTGWRCSAGQTRCHHGQRPDALRSGHADRVSSRLLSNEWCSAALLQCSES